MMLPIPTMEPMVRFSASARLVLLGFWSEMVGGGRWDGSRPVKYRQPFDEQDATSGMVHAKTGIWFPGSEILETSEGRAPRPFAHEERE